MPDVVFHRLDHSGVLRRLGRYARDDLGRRPEVSQVVLIGSLARGDWSARSDADLVIVVDEAHQPARSRSEEYAPAGGMGVAVDLFVYTSEEAASWSPRFRSEVEGGMVLYRRS